jgi:hypothetical protein
MSPKRRDMTDERLASFDRRLTDLERKLDENTAMTKDVRDILGTFRIVGLAAKWTAAIGAAGLAVYHGWQAITGR